MICFGGWGRVFRLSLSPRVDKDRRAGPRACYMVGWTKGVRVVTNEGGGLGETRGGRGRGLGMGVGVLVGRVRDIIRKR